MGKFLDCERPIQAKFKKSSEYFSEGAGEKGEYKEHFYCHCLPVDLAHENLYPEIREPIMSYFARHEIKWHDGHKPMPSNHMCDSQVCCANFLFPFADKPKALATLLRPIFPLIDQMLPVEDGLYVAFEWIGKENYLGELISRNGKRTRGANFTSADAIVAFQRLDGRKQVVLIEWKYTESYSGTNLQIARSGRSRVDIYRHLFARNDCPLDQSKILDFGWVFYEPFYQLMRQQFLANEMEKAHEKEADVVSLLHLSPEHNADFNQKVTSPELKRFGDSPTAVWKTLLNTPNRFDACFSEDLFGKFKVSDYPELQSWFDYITSRYRWVVNGALSGN
jgi:hypothetical protein